MEAGRRIAEEIIQHANIIAPHILTMGQAIEYAIGHISDAAYHEDLQEGRFPPTKESLENALRSYQHTIGATLGAYCKLTNKDLHLVLADRINNVDKHLKTEAGIREGKECAHRPHMRMYCALNFLTRATVEMERAHPENFENLFWEIEGLLQCTYAIYDQIQEIDNED